MQGNLWDAGLNQVDRPIFGLQVVGGTADKKFMLKKYLLVLALGLVLPTAGYALGIRLFDHDAFATARGDAFVATADNPSAIYYNPAGITQLQGHNVRAGLNLLMIDYAFDRGAGRNVKTENDWISVPGFYYSYTASNCPVSFGVGYYLPYG